MREGWEKVSLGKLTTQVSEPLTVQEHLFYTSLGLRMYGKGVFAREPKLGGSIKAAKLYSVRAGQFVYNRMFASGGSFGTVPPSLSHGVVSNEFPIFDVHGDRLLTPYLDLYFQQPDVWAEVERECTGTTKSRNRWKEADFAQHRIPLPPLPEQRRIVDLIGSLDEAIEAAVESANALDHMYLASLGKVNNSGFELRLLEGVLSKAKAGGTPSRRVPENYGGSIPWLKSGEVESDSITTSSEFITVSALASSSAWLAPAGSTVVAMYGQGDTKGKAGYLRGPVAMNQAVIALVPNEGIIDRRYLFHIMRSKTGSLRKKAVGAAQPNLSKNIVVNEEIPLPPLGAQSKIASLLDAALDSKRLSEEYASSLRTLRTNLLTALLSGAHEIPDSYDELLAEAV